MQIPKEIPSRGPRLRIDGVFGAILGFMRAEQCDGAPQDGQRMQNHMLKYGGDFTHASPYYSVCCQASRVTDTHRLILGHDMAPFTRNFVCTNSFESCTVTPEVNICLPLAGVRILDFLVCSLALTQPCTWPIWG